MKKIPVNSLTRRQMEYAFAKHIGILMGDDTIIVRNNIGFLSVYSLGRFNICNNSDLLNMILKEKFQKIDVTRNNQSYVATFNGVTAKDEEKNVAMIKAFLLFKSKNIGEKIEIPDNVS